MSAEINLNGEDLENIVESMKIEAEKYGMEAAPFLVKWYNDTLKDKRFQLGASGNTLAFLIISAPSMFEKAFLPFMLKDYGDEGQFERRDPLDECMMHYFRLLGQTLPTGYDVEPMHDFETSSPVSKRPKVLVQTAGHVAGIVRFYQQHDLNGEGLEKLKELAGSSKTPRVFPVCVHPKYGGWFGLRGILLCRNVTVNSSLQQRIPPHICQSQAEIAKLLYLFNYHWSDWRYRDIGVRDNVERYSELQKEYFGLAPEKRKAVLAKIFDNNKIHADNNNEDDS